MGTWMGCDKNKDDTPVQPEMEMISGYWELMKAHRGFGRIEEYHSQEVVYIFDVKGNLEVKNTQGQVPFLKDGNYSYAFIPDRKDSIRIGNGVHGYSLTRNRLEIFDHPAADGPLYEFQRIINY
jgi:hypothetical protein